ncbi:3-beta hydroxysteroid dehydrogenase/isomerase family-domain-containing protein [Dipodascopsis tothii]|uniref:3-beta hydroxysteroid dehydrogenase/isomerase family-domain-containing protein n=1 Tax=Dipodascopsis tothii TaxID=44089 RepID=UPI0034CD1C61
MNRVLIVGGSGFLGGHLIERLYLLEDRPEIHVLDIRPPPAPSSKFYSYTLEDVTFHQGDLTSPESIKAVLETVRPEVVIHCASPVHGMGKEIYFKVNVDGTKNVVDCVAESGFVKALVYTSTASVIYDGSDLRNADETFPIPEVAMDAYNETKVLGEKYVLESNGKNGVVTCAIRPSGLFGPGDRQLVPGMLAVLKTNGTIFQLGDNLNLFDFTYIGNVAHAHVLAAQCLLDEKKVESVAGEPFFITNDTPVYFFTMPRTIWAHKGYVPRFTIKMSRPVGMTLAYLSEWYSWLMGREALFTRFRVAFTCANRYFNISKAKNCLDYKPIVGLEEGVLKTLEWIDDEDAKAAAALVDEKEKKDQ